MDDKYYLEFEDGYLDEEGNYSEEPVYMTESEASQVVEDYKDCGDVLVWQKGEARD